MTAKHIMAFVWLAIAGLAAATGETAWLQTCLICSAVWSAAS